MEEEVDDTDVMEDIPAPSGEFSDNAAYVTIPLGDWEMAEAYFELAETADDDAVWEWAAELPEDADYYPGDYVMRGHVEFHDDAISEGYAIGLIYEDWDTGIMAKHSGDEKVTLYFARK